LVGPSGVGKSTVLREVRKRCGARFSVSATTRERREGEVHGEDYLFVDRPVFESMIRDREMLEWAEVFGEYYGTPGAPVMEAREAGEAIVLDVDVQGAAQLHERLPEAVYVFLLPPSDEVLAQRLRGRGTDSEETIRRRLAKAKAETRTARDSGVFDLFVVNDELSEAVRQVADILRNEQEPDGT